MPIINYHYKIKDMPALNKKQRCDICGVEHIGHYMYYSYYPTVGVLCKKCAAQQSVQRTCAQCGADDWRDAIIPDTVEICNRCGASR